MLSPRASSELTVVGFNGVVGVLLDVVPRRRHQFVEHGGVDRCGAGHHLARDDLQDLERSGEESAGCRGVPTAESSTSMPVEEATRPETALHVSPPKAALIFSSGNPTEPFVRANRPGAPD
jgi:hypothetical protein